MLNQKVILLAFAASFIWVGSSSAIQVSGDIWGTWDPSNNPYEVIGDLHVPRDSSLTIMPGCSIQFQGHYFLKVDSMATLTAVGTAQDSIYYFPADTATGWAGVRLYCADTTSRISYCSFKYRIWLAGDSYDYGAICGNYGTLNVRRSSFYHNFCDSFYLGTAITTRYQTITTIDNCRFIENGTRDSLGDWGKVLNLDAPATTVSNCYFNGNIGGLIICWSGGLITGNIMTRNRGIPICSYECFRGFQVDKNIIYDNWDQKNPGFLSIDTPSRITNNTFYNNTCAFPNAEDAGVVVQTCDHFPQTAYLNNNIFWGDSSMPQLKAYYGIIDASYNNILNGWPGTGNIDSGPMFVDTANVDFHLQAGSPCIDAGDPTSPVDPDWSRSDMGALPFTHTFSVYIPGDISGDGQRSGADVTYGVRYFKGWNAPPPDSLYNDSTGTWVYAAADVNGDCEFLGADITYLVGYYKGINPILKWCPQTPPY